MRLVRPARAWAAVLFATLCSSSALAATLDSFTGALPPNPCLPNSNGLVVFQGPYCDGVSCPPDPLADANCPSSDAEQTSAPGTLNSTFRLIYVSRYIGFSGDGETVVAAVNPALGRLEVTESGGGHGSAVGTIYGDYDPSPDALNLDMTAPATGSVSFALYGDISASQPLHVHIELSGTGGGRYLETVVTEPGSFTFPLASFTDAGLDPTDVDLISIDLGDCPIGGNCGTAILPARSYAIGAISVGTSGPTAAKRSSWAKLKAHYR